MISSRTFISTVFSLWVLLPLITLSISFETIADSWMAGHSRYRNDPATACKDYIHSYYNDQTDSKVQYENGTWQCYYFNDFYNEFSRKTSVNFYNGVGSEACTEIGVDLDENGNCIDENQCKNKKPIATTQKTALACFGGCQYGLGGWWKNWDGLNTITMYEYLSNNQVCTGSEDNVDETAKENTDNAENQSCSTNWNLTVCETSDGCKTYNGQKICETDNKKYNCGTYQGQVVCYERNYQKNCGIVNGQALCLNSYGDKFADNSPDNPKNGGNGDGDEFNDPFSKDEIENKSGAFENFESEVRKEIAKQNSKEMLSGTLDNNDSGNNDSANVEFSLDEKYNAGTIEESVNNYYAAFSDVPLIQALNINPQLNNDNCPPLQFDDLAYVGSQGTTIHCDIIDDNRDALEILFKALWIIAGIFIIFMG